MLSLAALERLESGVDRRRERRAALRDDADVDGVQALREGSVVERERTLHEGGAGERDQSDAVAVQLADEILNRELGARQSIRLDVGGEHAARGVEGDDEVDAFALDLLPAKAPQRAAERERQRQHRGDEERGTHETPARIEVGRDRRPQG